MFAVLKRLRNISYLLLRCAAFVCVYPLSFFIPRNRSVWVYSSNKGAFTDNSKYLFLWMSEFRPDIKSIWIAHSKTLCDQLIALGYQAYHRRSPRGIWARLRAGVYVYSYGLQDIGVSFAGNAVKINLWHGVGIKNVEFKIKTGATARYYDSSVWNPYRLLTPEKYIRPDLFICTSSLMEEHFLEAFRLKPKNVLRAGYPRVDFYKNLQSGIISSRIDNIDWFLKLRRNFERVVLYMPTFRDSQKKGIADALGNMRKLDEIMKSNRTVLLIKAHPAEDFVMDECYSSIFPLPNNCDIYPVLRQVDGLITDYSSVLYDYIAAGGTRIILYTYDLDEYLHASRDFAYPYAENTTGVHVSNLEQLYAALITLEQAPHEEIERLKDRFWGYANRNSCEFIGEEVNRVVGTTFRQMINVTRPWLSGEKKS